jgi:hypothetical protein
MKKKFPDLIKSNPYSEKPKSYMENEKINNMRTKIEKMF